MKVWITLRLEEISDQEYYEPPCEVRSVKAGDVFTTLEKAKEYVELGIAQDMQEAFHHCEEPIERKDSVDAGKKGIEIELIHEKYFKHIDHTHSIKWIILEKELA